MGGTSGIIITCAVIIVCLSYGGCSNKKKEDMLAFQQELKCTFGAEKADFLYDILPTTDGGFLVAGNRSSIYRQDTTDIWLFKFDSSLTKIWDRIIGAERAEQAMVIRQLAGGNFLLAGKTESKGQGWSDIWLMELDSSANIVWDTTYGWGKYEDPADLIFTPESTVILIGTSQWEGIGDNDMWILHLTKVGGVIWSQNYGGEDYEKGWAIESAPDGCFVVAATTGSKGAGDYDGWIVKIDRKGNLIWDKAIGTPLWQEFYTIRKSPKGGYLAGGSTVPQGRQDRDAWLVHTDDEGNIIWQRELGEYQEGNKEDFFDAIFDIQLCDNGNFLLCGVSVAARPYIDSYAWVKQVNNHGTIIWETKLAIGKNGWFDGKIVARQLSNGGFIMGGSKFINKNNMWDMWLCLLDKKGKQY